MPANELLKLVDDQHTRAAVLRAVTRTLAEGMGPVILKAIRERCAKTTKNRDADRVENVIR